GADEATIRGSVNAKGSVSVQGGALDLPQLAAAGPGAGRITGLDVKADVTDLSKPLALAGALKWNGEAVNFATTVALVDLLAGKAGGVTLDLKSKPVQVNFSGSVGMDGSAKGKANIEAKALERLLRWIGQDIATPFKSLSYAGGISADAKTLTLSDAKIALDAMQAAGTVSVGLAGKTAIKASLSVDALDFATLTGGS